MRSLILTTIAIGLTATFATTSYACFCVTPEVPEAFEEARAVFVGEVTEIIEPRTRDPHAPLPGWFYTIKFKVQRSWKGVPFALKEYEVLSAQGHYGCLAYPPVLKGGWYLVYAAPAYSEYDEASRWTILWSCNRTSLLSFAFHGPDEINAYDDMKQLDQLVLPSFKFEPKLPLWNVSTTNFRDSNTFRLSNELFGKPVEQH